MLALTKPNMHSGVPDVASADMLSLHISLQGKGKLASQCAHGAVGQYKKLFKRKDPNVRRWVSPSPPGPRKSPDDTQAGSWSPNAMQLILSFLMARALIQPK